jgi:hypothetical protein
LALLTGTLVAEAHRRGDEARAAWGTTIAVLVTTGPIEAGEPLAPNVDEIRWPRALAPADPVRTLPPDARAATDLGAGVPVVTRAVRGEDRVGGGATVAIATGDVGVSTAVGDRVDLWATVDPLTVSDGDATTVRVARRARVAALDEQSLSVALRPAEVPAVVEALATATITVVSEG